MSIEYAVTLYARDNKSGEPASVADIARIVGEWAEAPDPESLTKTTELVDVGRRRATITTRELDLGPDQDWAWKFELSHFDSEHASVTWTVSISVLESPGAAFTPVSVTLARHTTGGYMLPPLRSQPAPPGVIGKLIDNEVIACFDGNHPLSSSVETLAPAYCREIARELILDQNRRLPMIAISALHATGKPALAAADIERLQKATIGAAHLYVIPPETQRALSEALPEGLGVYNGGSRIWWPRVRQSPGRFDHPLWTRERADHTARDIARRISTAAAAHFRPIAEIEHIERTLLRQEFDRDLDDLLRSVDGTGQVRDSDQEHMIRRLKEEYDDAISLAEAYEKDLREEAAKRLNLEGAVRDLQGRLYHLQRMGEGTPSEDGPITPSEEFIGEVQASYRERYTDHDRREFPIAEIRLHPNFLDAVESLQGISRDKIVEVCADVACRRAETSFGRQVHVLRNDIGRGSGQRERGSDGAKAWRCYLQTGTPSARRLHWWRIDADTVEFAHVGVHDDETCPE